MTRPDRRNRIRTSRSRRTPPGDGPGRSRGRSTTLDHRRPPRFARQVSRARRRPVRRPDSPRRDRGRLHRPGTRQPVPRQQGTTGRIGELSQRSFDDYHQALDFCSTFFHWQNFEHHHWGLGLLTPATVHRGQADSVLAARQAVLDAAYAAHPDRFVRKPPQPLILPSQVWINPPADGPEPRTLELPRYTDFDEELSQTG